MTTPRKPYKGLAMEGVIATWYARNMEERHAPTAPALTRSRQVAFREVRRRWFALSQEHPVEGELSTEGRVERLAAEFAVTPAAMRVRLQQMKLIRQ